MKIHLVDGTYELFRSHCGAPPKQAPDGRPVGARLGLLMLVTTPGVTLTCWASSRWPRRRWPRWATRP